MMGGEGVEVSLLTGGVSASGEGSYVSSVQSCVSFKDLKDAWEIKSLSSNSAATAKRGNTKSHLNQRLGSTLDNIDENRHLGRRYPTQQLYGGGACDDSTTASSTSLSSCDNVVAGMGFEARRGAGDSWADCLDTVGEGRSSEENGDDDMGKQQRATRVIEAKNTLNRTSAREPFHHNVAAMPYLAAATKRIQSQQAKPPLLLDKERKEAKVLDVVIHNDNEHVVVMGDETSPEQESCSGGKPAALNAFLSSPTGMNWDDLVRSLKESKKAEDRFPLLNATIVIKGGDDDDISQISFNEDKLFVGDLDCMGDVLRDAMLRRHEIEERGNHAELTAHPPPQEIKVQRRKSRRKHSSRDARAIPLSRRENLEEKVERVLSEQAGPPGNKILVGLNERQRDRNRIPTSSAASESHSLSPQRSFGETRQTLGSAFSPFKPKSLEPPSPSTPGTDLETSIESSTSRSPQKQRSEQLSFRPIETQPTRLLPSSMSNSQPLSPKAVKLSLSGAVPPRIASRLSVAERRRVKHRKHQHVHLCHSISSHSVGSDNPDVVDKSIHLSGEVVNDNTADNGARLRQHQQGRESSSDPPILPVSAIENESLSDDDKDDSRDIKNGGVHSLVEGRDNAESDSYTNHFSTDFGIDDAEGVLDVNHFPTDFDAIDIEPQPFDAPTAAAAAKERVQQQTRLLGEAETAPIETLVVLNATLNATDKRDLNNFNNEEGSDQRSVSALPAPDKLVNNAGASETVTPSVVQVQSKNDQKECLDDYERRLRNAGGCASQEPLSTNNDERATNISKRAASVSMTLVMPVDGDMLVAVAEGMPQLRILPESLLINQKAPTCKQVVLHRMRKTKGEF